MGKNFPGKPRPCRPRKRNKHARATNEECRKKKVKSNTGNEDERNDATEVQYMSGVEDLPSSSPPSSPECESCASLPSENEENDNMAMSDEGSLPELIVVNDSVRNHSISGNRIVDIQHFMKEMSVINEHHKFCTLGRFELKSEQRNGLAFKLKYYCSNCEKYYVVSSVPSERNDDINNALVWGALSVGIGYSQAEELFSVLDIPFMSNKKFKKHEEMVGENWEAHLYQMMKENGEKERDIALEKNHVRDGIPYITVLGDGGWCKRTYGHGFSSPSGVAVLIGMETNKLLYLGVRNKFCFSCARSKTQGKPAPSHTCYLNYSGASTGMEQSIIVEGFNQSVQEHNLLYLKYIGDGDSSVFPRIQEQVSYGRYVEKIECSNHITRALSDGLHKISRNTLYPLEGRRVLTETVDGIMRIERLVKGVRTAIKSASILPNKAEACTILRTDVANALEHVCGKHENCTDFCQRKDLGEKEVLSILKSSKLVDPIRNLMDRIIRNADRLTSNETTNQAERYMSLVSKFIGGKRVNYASRGSYNRRVIGAGICHTLGPSWHASTWKKICGRSPGKSLKRLCSRRENVRSCLSKRYAKSKWPKKRKTGTNHSDKDYGEECTQPDLPESDLQKKAGELLKQLEDDVCTPDKRIALERSTKEQHDSALWRATRLNRLTASNFGPVIRRLEHTSCHNLVKNILFKKELNTQSVQFGRLHEKTAILQYEEINHVKTEKCGIFVSHTTPYLGASPDALVGSDGIVEVKCFPSIGDNKIIDMVKEKRVKCFEETGGTMKLKKTHCYYYQIQGQLNISGKSFCDFVAYSTNDIFVERICKDEVFWQNMMLPKLKRFYLECMLPEIVDSRIKRKMSCRDPTYVLEAQKRRGQKPK